ncbi:hypothetical protein HID58_082294 [Brassica napus]|uniref:Uncharacterized protein n=1 Tax=Brassica napus TaxID=3708 RepID=A0ABQ7YA50_BRANA|nr:hypothetical protein HID58_082294 [Brassica napus]
MAMTKETAAVEDGWVVCCAGGHFVALRLVQSFSKRHFVAFLAKSLILLHQDEEEQTIQHLQGEDMRNIQGRHQEVILEEKKMENTVAGPIPLAMKVDLLQSRRKMERMRLESK